MSIPIMEMLIFLSKFKQLMLIDYDVCEFQNKWDNMVVEFGLEEI